MAKSPDAFRTISEVAEWLGVQAHVLRFWESKFTHVKPVKRAGGRRYYRPTDMLLLGGIKKLLHDDGLTIKGVQKILREQGVSYVSDHSLPLDDLTTAILDSEVAEVSETAKVLPYQSRTKQAAGRHETPELVVVPDPEPSAEAIASGAQTTPKQDDPVSSPFEPTAIEEPETPVDFEQAREPEKAEEDAPEQPSALPSFMHKPELQTPEPKRARLIEVAETPPEDEIVVDAGALAQVSALRRIPGEHLDTVRAIHAKLENLNARLTGTDKE